MPAAPYRACPTAACPLLIFVSCARGAWPVGASWSGRWASGVPEPSGIRRQSRTDRTRTNHPGRRAVQLRRGRPTPAWCLRTPGRAKTDPEMIPDRPRTRGRIPWTRAIREVVQIRKIRPIPYRRTRATRPLLPRTHRTYQRSSRWTRWSGGSRGTRLRRPSRTSWT